MSAPIIARLRRRLIRATRNSSLFWTRTHCRYCSCGDVPGCEQASRVATRLAGLLFYGAVR